VRSHFRYSHPHSSLRRQWGGLIFEILALLAVLFLLALILSSFAREARASLSYSPAPYPECLPRETLSDLRAAGASAWELLAVRVITRDGRSKGPVDWIERECGLSGLAGPFHFTPGRLRLYRPPEDISYCPAFDEDYREAVLSLLYSEAAGPVLLATFRRIVNQPVTRAREAGLYDQDLALVAALANNSPRLMERIGERCEWGVPCIMEEWSGRSPHLQRRVDTWRAFSE
jgi:hypothetical protein